MISPITGKKCYLSLELDWDYDTNCVHLSMMNYVADALKRFHHSKPKQSQDHPYPHIKPTYGAKKQYAAEKDTSPLLSKAEESLSKKSLALFCTIHRQLMLPYSYRLDTL